MICRDYRKELGLESATPRVPWPIAVVLLAAIAGGAWYGIAELRSLPSHKVAAPHASTPTPATTLVHK